MATLTGTLVHFLCKYFHINSKEHKGKIIYRIKIFRIVSAFRWKLHPHSISGLGVVSWITDNSPQRQLAPRQLAQKKTRPKTTRPTFRRQLAPHSEDNSPHSEDNSPQLVLTCFNTNRPSSFYFIIIILKTTRPKTTRPKKNSPQDNSPHIQKTTRPTFRRQLAPFRRQLAPTCFNLF